jgi:hypothetical protein
MRSEEVSGFEKAANNELEKLLFKRTNTLRHTRKEQYSHCSLQLLELLGAPAGIRTPNQQIMSLLL